MNVSFDVDFKKGGRSVLTGMEVDNIVHERLKLLVPAKCANASGKLNHVIHSAKMRLTWALRQGCTQILKFVKFERSLPSLVLACEISN